MGTNIPGLINQSYFDRVGPLFFMNWHAGAIDYILT
jgi:hypothetical protein